MGLFDNLANSAYAAKLHVAVAKRLGLHHSELPEETKKMLDRMAIQNRASGVSAEQVAEWFVQGMQQKKR